MSQELKKDLNINVEYLTRVEGHGNIKINIKNGKLEECHLNVIEAPRFFEVMVKGRSMFEVQHITSRICGICSTGHSLASIKATEDAIGFSPTEQTKKLRKVALHLETLDSHLLHVLFLVAPDCLGVESVFPLIKTHPDIVILALKMKKICSDLCDLLLGRHTHPITLCVRGFTKIPTKKELEKMKKLLLNLEKDLDTVIGIVKTLKLPSFERKTEYIALTHSDEYAFLDGNIASSEEGVIHPKDYLNFVHEFYVEHSTSKHSKNKKNSYMVGSLARFNINHKKLSKKELDLADSLGLQSPCYNPFMNTIAQVVETAYCLRDTLSIIEDFLINGINANEAVSSWPTIEEQKTFKIKPGKGVGAVEVPRGILFHDYTIDTKGLIEKANCVIPTNQNLANIDMDLKKMIPEILNKSKEEITIQAEMLIRAYDPCISCSCHYLNVEFV
ncbi:MAG: nickel-dependent hydrogenase large subunit [bacterium]